MHWTDYMKIAGGIYTPEPAKTMSNRSKLIVAEGLSTKNLLRMPAKPTENRTMENDLRRFVTGKPILNEVAPLVAAAIAPEILAAGEGAAVAGGVAAAGAEATAGATAAGATAAGGAENAASLAADGATERGMLDNLMNTKGDSSDKEEPLSHKVANDQASVYTGNR